MILLVLMMIEFCHRINHALIVASYFFYTRYILMSLISPRYFILIDLFTLTLIFTYL